MARAIARASGGESESEPLSDTGAAFVRRNATRTKVPVMSDSNATGTVTWPDLAIGLYDRLTGRNAEITYEADNFELSVPSAAGADAAHAKWTMNGTLRIRTREA